MCLVSTSLTRAQQKALQILGDLYCNNKKNVFTFVKLVKIGSTWRSIVQHPMVIEKLHSHVSGFQVFRFSIAVFRRFRRYTYIRRLLFHMCVTGHGCPIQFKVKLGVEA